MRERGLPGTGLRLTELGFGAASLGNLYVETPDEVAAATVDAAWEAGIRYFDTAPHYGLGLSERRLGAALRGRPRDEYVLSTKVGRLLVPRVPPADRDDDIFEVPGDLTRRWDFTRDGVRRSIDESLARLGVDRIDIAYVHDPDASGVPGAAASAAEALIELREEGVLRAVGIGTNSVDAALHLLSETDIDTAMIAGRVTLLDHGRVEELLAAAGTRRLVAAAVFNGGLLAVPRPASGAHFDYRPAPDELLARANRIADVAQAHGATLPQAALAYPLTFPGVATRVVGMRTPEEVSANVALATAEPPAALWDALRAASLLD
ncbi:aldo/keto reductase [Leifsonia sp. F6_8S_P_1B]|uniref:Aldo/keto reductase n=1 Tax=Leifsonia williamsii TaxID=3035919 RepID=A0ABT8K8Z5_9MICO|nr:aldo/keto reductase [Leifsonia williamsii]MDN4613915.1 aldo/keto reductase [Leifsonia williamsii]